MGSLWNRRSLRARLTLTATAVLAIGIGAAGLLLVRGFAASRIHAIDRSASTVADNLASYASAGALPVILPVQSGQSAQVLDAQGRVLAVSPGASRTLLLVPLDVVRERIRARTGELQIDAVDPGNPSRAAFREVQGPSGPEYVVVAASLADERDTVRDVTRFAGYTAPLLLVVFAAMLWLLLGRALQAVSAMRRAAEAVADPVDGTRLPLPTSSDEVHALAVTLNAMLDRLAAASARERAFVADAAHELRSPLTSLRTQLEVAAAHPSSTTPEELSAGALEDVDRLSSMVEDLLVLARIDAGVEEARAGVDLSAIAGVPDQGPVIVTGNAAALRRVVENLVANARRHARSEVVVTVAARGDVACLSVEDDGPGVPAPDRERVFERFVRLDDARTREEGGSGLGLAIVRATIRAHGGDVTVVGSELGGASFVATIPLAGRVEED